MKKIEILEEDYIRLKNHAGIFSVGEVVHEILNRFEATMPAQEDQLEKNLEKLMHTAAILDEMNDFIDLFENKQLGDYKK